ncbi:MAG: chromate efflux transporter [Bacteroidales bacterium]
MEKPVSTSLKYLFFTFLKIGATSWGGFMALISVVQKQIVDKDKKLDNEILLEGISLASVLPGPMAFNVVTFVGYKLKGIRGALVSMAGIVLPSFLLMLALSFLYLKYGNIPSFTRFFAGVLPAVAAIIISVAFALAKKNITDVPQILIAVTSAIVIALSKAYITTLTVMFLSGLIGYLIYHKKLIEEFSPDSVDKSNIRIPKIGFLIPLIMATCFLIVIILPVLLPSQLADLAILQRKILLSFSSMSLSLFGGGYVIIPAMQQIIVDSLKWLTAKEFTDAIAMGQITPGPIFISATFIGFKLAGFWGALNATVAIFLPPGLLMITCSHFFDRIRNSVAITAIFKGLRPAIIGMIAAAAYKIMVSNGFTVQSVLLICIFLILAIRYKMDPAILIPGAGIIGLLIF